MLLRIKDSDYDTHSAENPEEEENFLVMGMRTSFIALLTTMLKVHRRFLPTIEEKEEQCIWSRLLFL